MMNDDGEGHLLTRQDAANQNELRHSRLCDAVNELFCGDFLAFSVLELKDYKCKFYNEKFFNNVKVFCITVGALDFFVAAVPHVATGENQCTAILPARYLVLVSSICDADLRFCSSL